jgi:hypothetical protein
MSVRDSACTAASSTTGRVVVAVKAGQQPGPGGLVEAELEDLSTP